MSNTTQMACPKCKYAYTKTTHTSNFRNKGNPRRIRKCVKCSQTFVTYEIKASEYNMLQTIREAIRTTDQNDDQESKDVVSYAEGIKSAWGGKHELQPKAPGSRRAGEDEAG